MNRNMDLIDLRELPLGPGQRLQRTIDLDLEPVSLAGQTYQVLVSDHGVDVEVERISGGFMVRLRFSASVYGPCFRCLREVKVDVAAEQEEFVPRKAAEWAPADVSPFVRDLVVDVAGLAREALILGLPLKILCAEACPGLCPECGRPAHEGACTEAAESQDPRWARLRELHLE